MRRYGEKEVGVGVGMGMGERFGGRGGVGANLASPSRSLCVPTMQKGREAASSTSIISLYSFLSSWNDFESAMLLSTRSQQQQIEGGQERT